MSIKKSKSPHPESDMVFYNHTVWSYLLDIRNCKTEVLFFFYYRVLILDEVDSLDSKNQEVLYTMFEWPALNNSRAILVGEYFTVAIQGFPYPYRADHMPV